MKLADKVVLITGAGSGIGRQTALHCAREGAHIAAVDIDVTTAKETADAIAADNGQAIAIAADVSRAADCERMVQQAEAAYGRLDVLFNNAGISHHADADAIDTEEEVWDLTMAVNLKGVFLGCKYGIPALRRAGGGAIVNTASFVALLGAATPQLAYTASKGGVLALTRELAVIHARENIRVNALCPGPLRTELLMKYLDSEEKAPAPLGPHPHGPLRRGRGDRPHGRLLGLGRRLLYHGLDLRRRWRHHRCLCHARVRPPMRFAAAVFDLDSTLLAEPLDY